MTVFGDGALKEVIWMGPNWYPYKRQKLGCTHTGTHTHREDHVKTEGKTVICDPGRKASEETSPLTPGSWTSSLRKCERMNFCCLSHLSWVLYYGTPSKLIQ